MLISCEQCSTTYSLDDHLVSPEGRSVQCMHCGHVFVVRPPGIEELSQALAGHSPLQEGPAPSHGEARAPSLRTTQIFGFSPEEEMLLSSASSASSAERSFEYGHLEKQASASPRESSSMDEELHAEPNAIAYFDFGANLSGEDPLLSHFSSLVPGETPLERPASSSASPRMAASPAPSPAQETPPSAVAAPSAELEPAQQIFEAEPPSVVDEVWQAEEQAAQLESSRPKPSFSASSLAHAVEEHKEHLVEELPLQQAPPSEAPLKSQKKDSYVFIIFLVLLMLASALGVWVAFQ